MLPNPLPDDPRKWDGWSRFNSNDFYERLGLSFESKPTTEQIEEHSRLLQVWWQKKLPLKNQPSNPLAQLLRGGIDLAPRYIAQARAELLNPERRAQIDAELQQRQRTNALTEFQKFLDFALSDKLLTLEEEANLLKMGRALGLSGEDVAVTIQQGIKATGATREADQPPPPPAVPVPTIATQPDEKPRTRRVRHASPKDDFWRMLQLSGLDAESMSDERRDTFIDMAENMGLDPGAAEDLVDDYLEAIENGTLQVRPRGGADAPATPLPARPATARVMSPAAKGGTATVQPAAKATVQTPLVTFNPQEERKTYRDFVTATGTQMRFIPSAAFSLGSNAAGAPVNEGPVTRVTVSRFYMSRFPITNAEYEVFDPGHRTRRGAWANDKHPVIYVSALEAEKFCQWLSQRERKKFRLSTEAEWEYAAKGTEGFTYPWGDATGLGTLANFADANTTFTWRDPNVNDGYAETSPVGAYPAGKSRANVEDLAGNVWEWCQDWYGPYTGRESVNPRGPKTGTQRVYRGGSWKSRFANLKCTARGYNLPGYASNDVGFRVVCECE